MKTQEGYLKDLWVATAQKRRWGNNIRFLTAGETKVQMDLENILIKAPLKFCGHI